MDSKTIVAIEIASSKIKGAAGIVDGDGRITVLAVEEIAGINNVRYGRVQNIREVSAAVNEIIRRIETSPTIRPRTINALAVALGGRSLGSIPARASQRFPRECEITERHIDRLAFEAARDFMGDKNIEDAVPRRFYVNNSAVRHPVGIFGESLRGDFVMITCAKETRQNLDRIKYDSIEAGKATYIIRATALADQLLSTEEKELGTALVDLGAETTTVAVYKEGTLASVCTIPMGSRLISKDLSMGLNVTEETAEAMKKNYASGMDVNNAELVGEYVKARAGEIVANVLEQLNQAGFNAQNLTKVVLTGGGSHIAAFGAQLTAQSKIAVRVASMPDNVSFRIAGRNSADNIDVVALLLAGARRISDNCLTELPEFANTNIYVHGNESNQSDLSDPSDPSDLSDSSDSSDLSDLSDEEPEETVINIRRVLDEDDPELCADDPDDDEQEPRQRRRFSIPLPGIFSRKEKNQPAPRQRRNTEPVFSEPDIDDPFTNDTAADDEEIESQPTANTTANAGAKIMSIHDTICKLFSTNADEEENADEDDY